VITVAPEVFTKHSMSLIVRLLAVPSQ